jgi:hypothetical protein
MMRKARLSSTSTPSRALLAAECLTAEGIACALDGVAKGFIIMTGDLFKAQSDLSFYPTGGLYPHDKAPLRVRRQN